MNKYNYQFTENDYKTPPMLYKKAFEKLHIVCIDKFNLDACCTDENIPAFKYYKNGVQDGLKEPWENFTWCNPPFNECAKWVKKAFEENKNNGHTIVMLIPARTETAYWHKYILHNPFVEIEFLRKGYRFLNKDNEEMGVFKNALALVYFHSKETE